MKCRTNKNLSNSSREALYAGFLVTSVVVVEWRDVSLFHALNEYKEKKWCEIRSIFVLQFKKHLAVYPFHWKLQWFKLHRIAPESEEPSVNVCVVKNDMSMRGDSSVRSSVSHMAMGDVMWRLVTAMLVTCATSVVAWPSWCCSDALTESQLLDSFIVPDRRI